MEAPTRIRKQPGKKAKDTQILEKDDVELRLETALFGDDAGFLESLKRVDDTEHRSLVRARDNESEESDAEGGEDSRLSDVADEDVGPVFPKDKVSLADSDLALLSRHWHRYSPSSRKPRTRTDYVLSSGCRAEASMVRQRR